MTDLKALRDMAAQHHGAGRLAQAESLYRQILARSPDDASALYGLGAVALAVNQPAAAVGLLDRAAARDPRNAECLLMLGVARSMVGRSAEAGQAFQDAVAAAPGNMDARYNFGLHLLQTGSFAEAAQQFRRVVDKNPRNSDALMNLGIACIQAGECDEAVRRLRRCVQLAPDNREAQRNLANALYQTGAMDEAERAYRDMLARDQNDAATLYNLANLLRDTGRPDDAIEHYRRASQINPRAIEAQINLGNLYKFQRKWDAAESAFQAAVGAQPDSPEAHRNLAALDAQAGRVERAAVGFARAIAVGGDDAIRLQDAVLLPVIVDSEEQIQTYRRRMETKLAELSASRLHIPDPMGAGARPFHLAYHGLNDRPLMEALSRIYRSASPSLNFEAAHCAGYRAPSHRRLRVGFVSTYFRNHTIGRLNEHLIARLPRDCFEVFVFSCAGTADATAQRIAASADRFVGVPRDLAAVRRAIVEAELDVLYFTDIGMEPLTYFLAYARLAPVQCVTWGHPITTGISTVDYFISSDVFEGQDADDAYSEKLVRLKGPSVSFAMPGYPTARPAGGPAFICPQSLFKFHPDFDPIVADILTRSPGMELWVIEGEHPYWNERLETRWRRTIPQVCDRIRLIPRVTPADFVALLASARVALDTTHFCGGMTSFETFAMGTPVVTLPGAYTRGRLTTGYYRHMGLDDLIATDSGHYADLAVRLARDDTFRSELSQRLRANVGKLIDNAQPIDEHAAFFKRAVAAAAR